MRARTRNLSLGALAGVVLVAMLGAGGFPSRPKFQAVGINTPAPALQGGLALVPNAPGGGATLTVASTAGNSARAEFAANGNTIGATGMLYGQDASDIGYLWNRANQEVRFGTNNVHRGSVSAIGTFEFLSTGHFGGTGAGFFVTPHLSVQQAGSTNLGVRDTANAVEALLRAESSGVIAGAATNHSLTLRTNNTARATFAADGSLINLTATAVQANGVTIRPTIFCTAACNVSTLAVGQSALVVKTTDEAIATDATYTDDAVLQFLNFPVGSYSYRVGWQLEAGAGGAKAQLNFTGLATDTADVHGVRRCANGAVVAVVGAAFTTIGGENSCTGAGSSGVSYEGTFITVAATDDMFTQWAQVASNAAATTLSARSHMHVTRLK